MRKKPYDILLIRQDPDDEDDSVEYTWTSPEEREFCVREVGTEFFVEEMRPSVTGQFYKDGKLVTSGTLSDRLAMHYHNSRPSEFYRNLPDGITRDMLVLSGGGLGLGSITYPSMPDAIAAIQKALQNDTWYEWHDPELAKRREGEINTGGQQIVEKQQYWEQQLAALTEHQPGVPALFQGMCSGMGQLGDSARAALLSFVNKPCEDTWDELHGYILLGGLKTAWQIWVEHDPQAPRSKMDECWSTWPNPDAFLAYVTLEREAMIVTAKEKIAEAKRELTETLQQQKRSRPRDREDSQSGCEP